MEINQTNIAMVSLIFLAIVGGFHYMRLNKKANLIYVENLK
jgi:hypothetical protein